MNQILRKIVVVFAFTLLVLPASNAQKYFTAKEAGNELDKLAHDNNSSVKVHRLAQSFSGISINVYEFGTEVKQTQKQKPAIFIMANAEGDLPIATNAAVTFAKELLKDKENFSQFTWYLVPVLNPEALDHYFGNPQLDDNRNTKPYNDDMDDATDEDGPEDLNGDGFITQMRVVDPLGSWVPEEADARFLRKANTAKGEKGIYKLYTEGIDNDQDGLYNEDPKGGVNSGLNFPHLFKPSPLNGTWPGSEPQVYELMRFVYNHPEIAATFTFGSTDFCLQAPQGGRRGSADFSNIRIPRRIGEQFGVDVSRTYSMDEIIELMQPMVPEGMELTPSMVAGFLGLGAAVNPLEEDLKFYTELNKQYKEFLKGKGIEDNYLAPEKAKDASFELWSYYQLGVPTFSMNFFTLPKAIEEKKNDGSGVSIDQIEKMSNDEFIALGEEKIALFLKENKAPERFSAAKILEMIKGGQFTPAQMAGMLKKMPKAAEEGKLSESTSGFIAYDKTVLNNQGFIPWTSFDHPTLGKVEIGGEKAFVRTTPSIEDATKNIEARLPWIFELAKKLPQLNILKTEVKAVSDEIYKLDVWIQNENYLPFPTAMGSRNNQPAPAILLIDGKDLIMLDGKKRTDVAKVDGLKAVKFSFLIQAKKGTEVSLKLESKFAGSDNARLTLSSK